MVIMGAMRLSRGEVSTERRDFNFNRKVGIVFGLGKSDCETLLVVEAVARWLLYTKMGRHLAAAGLCGKQ